MKRTEVVLVSLMLRFHGTLSRTLRPVLNLAIFLSSLLSLSSSAESACRDPEVARSFGSVAYAANVDTTIQYFGVFN